MSVNTATNRFIVPPLRLGLYQHLITSTASFQELGNRLIRHAEQAHAFRQMDRVREVAEILSNLPLKQYQDIGHYYLALCTHRNGKGNVFEAQRILEGIFDSLPQWFRARVTLSLAAVSARKRDYESELYYYLETLKASQSITTSIEAQRGVAILKSKEGYHASAVKDFESILPIIKFAPPHVYFDYLNSYAVELGEVGRKYEARNIIKHVIASPFAFAYPEWQETANELKEPSRSFIAVPEIKRQHVEPKQVETPKPVSKPKQPASVLTFPKLKEAPLPEKPEKLSAREFGRMTARQKKELFMTAFRTDAIRESEYDSLASMCGLLEIDPADRVIHLEDIATLEDIIAVWCNMIEPDQFAAVMSALRDCSDAWRQHNIIDSMITIAFQQTRSHSESEEEWRSKVEHRLPEK